MQVRTDPKGFESRNCQNCTMHPLLNKADTTEIMLAIGIAGTVNAECEVKN